MKSDGHGGTTRYYSDGNGVTCSADLHRYGATATPENGAYTYEAASASGGTPYTTEGTCLLSYPTFSSDPGDGITRCIPFDRHPDCVATGGALSQYFSVPGIGDAMRSPGH